jgi:GAF domain-containing protein/anti-sigma regulatory factor (Ser/Thr protein kinase)
MLADVGRVLVSSLDAEEMVANLTRITVPTFADVCVLDMVQPDGSLRRVDVVGGPGLEVYAENLKRYPPDPANPEHPVVKVLNGAGPILTSKVTPELIEQNTRGNDHADLIRRMDGTSSIVVPLIGRARVLGVVSFLTIAASERTFTTDDIPLAEAVGRRAGMAVENAQLYQAEHAARDEATRATTALRLLADAGRLSATPLNEEVRIQQLAQITVPGLADACMIDILDDGTIRRVAAAAAGFEDFADSIAKFPPDPSDEEHPVVKVMNGMPSLFVEEIDDSFIAQVSRSDEHRATAEQAAVGSVIIVPLLARGGTYGALTLVNFATNDRRFHEDDVPLAEEIGRRAGVAVHNARLYRTERSALEEAEAARTRLTLLSDASRVLASSLDIDTTLANVAALTVPTLADICVIDTQEESGAMRRVAASGAPGLEEFAEQTLKTFPANPSPDHPVMRVIQGHGTQHIDQVDRSLLERLSPDEEWLLRVEKTDVLSAIMVPLVGRGGVLGGVLSLVTTGLSGRFLTPDDIPLAEEIGRRAGIAVENARLYAQQRSVAESLQHALLPHALPSIAGFEATARYQPGGPGERVGGDWYDLFEVPTGDLAVVMGDVVGHGIPAASLMAQLRNALRAYVWDGLGPADVLTRLNQLLYGLEREGMATVSLGLLDPIRNTMRVANAGHPPFLRLPEEGDPGFVGEGLGPPLGAVPFASFKEVLLELDECDTLVFYTDGLIEDRSESLDIGLERMRAAADAPGQDIEALCGAILEACIGDRDVEDDVAILVLRSMRMGAKLSMRLPAEPRVLSSLRQTLRRWLREHRVDEPDVHDVLVAMGEACNNAIEHGAAPLGGWFEVEAEIDGDLDVVVRSAGDWRAPRDDGGGRGLPVMEALMDRVDVDRSGQGIVVRMHRKLNGVRTAT